MHFDHVSIYTNSNHEMEIEMEMVHISEMWIWKLYIKCGDVNCISEIYQKMEMVYLKCNRRWKWYILNVIEDGNGISEM